MKGRRPPDPLLASVGAVVVDGDQARNVVTSLGFEPRALVVWWTQQSAHGVSDGNRGGIGFWAEGSTGIATGWTSDHSTPQSQASTTTCAAALVGAPTGSRGRGFEGHVAPLAGDGFVLEWSERREAPLICHFLALGGEGLRAHAGSIDLPRIRGTAEPELGGLRPDLVLLCPGAASGTGLRAGFGAFDGRRQAAASYATKAGASPGTVAGVQRTDSALVVVDPERRCVGTARCRFSPRLAVDWSPADPSECDAVYLALEGLRCHVGTTEAPRSPGARRTGGLGFRPEAILLFGWGLSASHDAKRIGRLSLGAVCTRTNRAVSASWDDLGIDVPLTATHVRSSATDAIAVIDSKTTGIHAAASYRSVDDDGFTLDWTACDTPRRQVVYAALGSPRAPSVLTYATRVRHLGSKHALLRERLTSRL